MSRPQDSRLFWAPIQHCTDWGMVAGCVELLASMPSDSSHIHAIPATYTDLAGDKVKESLG